MFGRVFQDSIGLDYDLERIIDDWILMGFLVGNDFIPHLPHLHINHDALPLLYKTYISVLPSLGGERHTCTLEHFIDLHHFPLSRFCKLRSWLTVIIWKAQHSYFSFFMSHSIPVIYTQSICRINYTSRLINACIKCYLLSLKWNSACTSTIVLLEHKQMDETNFLKIYPVISES